MKLSQRLYRFRGYVAQAIVTLGMWLDEDWCPPARWWPARDDDTDRALALLIARGYVFTLAPHPADEDEVPRIFVNCSDLFYWGCADAEPVPVLGFRVEDEVLFTDLYRRARTAPNGADVWCCLRRKMRPQACIEERWRRDGLWTPELEALPVREAA